jgi:hypothetical protein
MNKSDLGGVLQRDHIHIAVASPGAVATMNLAFQRAVAGLARKFAMVVPTAPGEATAIWM